ncbi:hypothetical protein [Bacillus sp. B15-48]|uniref:hypothetical protein n=1 Tax=Bacillus sp. B15-48 TaxID=1548601 RepID=UPI00193F19E4|nr:hypothetical protein [Bacillus sp. B15-48]MBM4765362.1 hypothetical protein [Bacillus sp. B15-48]
MGIRGTRNITVYGDAFDQASTPIVGERVELSELAVASNTILENNAIIVPESGVYQVNFNTNVLLNANDNLELILEGDEDPNRTRIRGEYGGTGFIWIQLGNTLLVERQAGESVAFIVDVTAGSPGLFETNLVVMKISNL